MSERGFRGSISTDLIGRWEFKRGELARLRALVEGAALVDEFLADLNEINAAELPVSLTEASRQTGYTADHLSRLVRAGRLSNHGRKNAPKVRVSECPQKAPPLANSTVAGYDPLTDARSLRVRR